MIVCPICGRATAVIETRASGSGSRRRRKCTDPACVGRVTTVEIVVEPSYRASDLADGRAILISRRAISRLQRAVAAIGGQS